MIERNRIRLVVKGPPKTAQRAASRHGVPAHCWTEQSSRRTKDSYCNAPCGSYSKLVNWHADMATGRKLRMRQFMRHPDGTLLFFSIKGCENTALKGARRRRRR